MTTKTNTYLVVDPELYIKRGKTVKLQGRFELFKEVAFGLTPAIHINKTKAYRFSAQTMIINEATNTVEYSPRMYPFSHHTPAVQKWLLEHPNWGITGCEKNFMAALEPVIRKEVKIRCA